MSQPITEIVDDRDPRVEYSGSWMLSGDPGEFNSTTHGTVNAGSQVKFTFKGTSVQVFGTISNRAPYTDAPASTYSLDGSPPQQFHPPPPDNIFYRQSFFKSSALEDKQHVLVITSTLSTAAFWLDYFEIVSDGITISSSPSPLPPPPPPPPPPQSTTTSSARIVFTTSKPAANFPTISSSSSISNNSSQIPTNASTSLNLEPSSVTQLPSSSALAGLTNNNSEGASAPPTNKPIPIGAIVGGVIGGVILIVLVFLSILYYRRKKAPQRVVSDVSVRGVSFRPVRSSFGTNQPTPSHYWDNESTRFIGNVAPFTGYSGSANGPASSSDGLSYIGEPVVPRDAMDLPYTITASGKAERQVGRGDEFFNLDVPPRYS
ncbi:hypothetical protein BDZ94DRAFT_194133 [Collybia nuda]|uniref:Uncharacterized protein n=1 Tax=Collybia nuda TaxID=64659 RepID=A0A9P5XVW7_9AGAR|nr:hypothetical protein BDZ94DRAFT_194133 [Collybia nuda]